MTAPSRRLTVFAVLGTIVLAIITVMLATRGGSSRSPRTLQIDVRASGDSAQLYWADTPQFVEEHSIRVALHPVAVGFQRLRFQLPLQGARWIRFDPSDRPGEILIGKVQLLDANGRLLGELDPGRFKPHSQIASISRQGDATRVVPEPAATDPALAATLACLDPPARLERLSQVTPAALALVSAAVLALLIACIAVLGRQVFSRGPLAAGPGVAVTPTPRRAVTAMWLAALFLIVFSAKLVLMRENPVTVPFWDQWDAEASQLYIPFDNCELSWPQMFSFHSEHRPFFTRLLALDLLVVNGQWDPRLEQVVNAAMHALTAVLIAAMFWIAGQRRRLDLLVLVCTLTFAVPFAAENTLSGFQSAFYLLLLFSVLALWLTTGFRTGSGPWWLGWICAMSALFATAGGIITTLAIVGMVALKLANDRSAGREALITLAAAAAVIGLGIAMASPPVPWHEPIKAHTTQDFVGAFEHNLAWPWIEDVRLAAIMWLPAVLVLVTVAVRRVRSTELERLMVGLGVWVVLNGGAVAYARGAGAALPQPRYMDFLSLGLVANAVALVVLLDRNGAGRLARSVAIAALVGWLAFAAVGVGRLTQEMQPGLSLWRHFYAAQAANVRQFVITGDLAAFTSKRPVDEIPYPIPAALAAILRDPYIRSILPAAVREPIHLEPRAVTNEAFEPDGLPEKVHDPLHHSWGSYSDRGAKAEGRFDSQPVPACRWGQSLRIPLSRYIGPPHQFLALSDSSSGHEVVIMPPAVPREGWGDAVVSCPDRPFAITAVDAANDSWFAFREPVEVGWASLAAERLIAWSRALLVGALALAGLAARWTGVSPESRFG